MCSQYGLYLRLGEFVVPFTPMRKQMVAGPVKGIIQMTIAETEIRLYPFLRSWECL